MALNEAPAFWWEKPGWQAWLTYPISYLWGRVSAKRMAAPPSASVPVPVICIGNFVAGGAGKTPTTLMFARHARRRGFKTGILSRGYGGGITKPTVVEPGRHNSHDVGDEPLLHAKQAITVVAADRPEGARLLVERGCDLIFMDDGFQNPSLLKDFCLIVADAGRGLGNGYSMPSGPMRAPLKDQVIYAHAVLLVGDGPAGDEAIRVAARAGKPTFTASASLIGHVKWSGKKVLAFAGIANPDNFFRMLKNVGLKIEQKQAYGDHHVYSEDDCNELLKRAEAGDLSLITTTKDAVRLANLGEPQARLLAECNTIELELVPDDPAMLDRIIDAAVASARERRINQRPQID